MFVDLILWDACARAFEGFQGLRFALRVEGVVFDLLMILSSMV